MLKKYAVIVTLALVLLSGMLLYAAGGQDDPVVLKSYLDEKLAEMNSKFAEEIKALKAETGSSNPASVAAPQVFEAISVDKDKTLILKKGTEFILRSGEALVIDGTGNGIPNITKGTNSKDGAKLVLNNLMLSPRDDGRALRFTQNSWLMLKGDYEIK